MTKSLKKEMRLLLVGKCYIYVWPTMEMITFGMQTVAPSSIIAWLKSPGLSWSTIWSAKFHMCSTVDWNGNFSYQYYDLTFCISRQVTELLYTHTIYTLIIGLWLRKYAFFYLFLLVYFLWNLVIFIFLSIQDQ